jgi:Spy/CpxP family protein refolding chaperone
MRLFVSTMTLVAGMAMLAAPVLAQAGPQRERPAFERGIRSGGPGSLILERRAELGLTDAQVQQIEAIRTEAVQRHEAARERLRAAMGERPVAPRNFRDLAAHERAEMRRQMQERRDQIRPVMEELRQANRAAGEQIHSILTADQRDQLQAIREARREEFRQRRGERGAGEWQNRGLQGRDGARRGPGARGPRGGTR